MASFEFPDEPSTSDVQNVALSAEERDFIGFLIYQFGDAFPTNKAGYRWYEQLQAKFP